ncbi:hypothetical protein DCS32_00490 [Dokdonia sp. Dokd-P16]|uniref:hypothetical protein n=1 Tax=Dokdonia sp. Dokd-P16 TaxID=2173169 RepID=UPI000D54648D|nr:hypothetical protein [Dokdonia sp. Dokd-P16]AWH72700.1 hypothetical protein DCS32_00490 [Dokdonia sp. Dokd-P16]
MDLGSITVGTIIVAICIIPFVMMAINKKKKENKMLQALNHIATTQNHTVSDYEFCGDFVIGRDKELNAIFFYKESNGQAQSSSVDLSTIKNCQAVKGHRNIKSDGEQLTITERVALAFTPSNGANQEVSFTLYDVDNMQLNGEIQLADSWSALINKKLQIAS